MQQTIDLFATQLQTVGKLDIEAIERLVGVKLPSSDVLLYPGALKHIRRKHPEALENHGHLIPTMISSPDFIGKNPSHPDSIEIYLQVDVYLLLSIQIDSAGYVCLSSFYDVHNGEHKLLKRLANGRAVPYAP